MYRNEEVNTCMKFELSDPLAIVVMEVDGLGFHPAVVCVTRVIHITFVDLQEVKMLSHPNNFYRTRLKKCILQGLSTTIADLHNIQTISMN